MVSDFTVLVRPASHAASVSPSVARKRPRIRFVTELSGHMGARGAPVPDLVVDCAGHDAITEFGPRILRTGIDLIVASPGALAETSVHTRLQAGASSGNARLVLPNCAIGGLDLIRALSQSETPRIVYRGVKPPTEWKGTAAEALVDLDILPEPC